MRKGSLVALAAAAILATVFMVQASIDPGCLAEQEYCTGCARARLKRAILSFDFREIRLANLDFWDCSIDLYHCIALGDHHQYACEL